MKETKRTLHITWIEANGKWQRRAVGNFGARKKLLWKKMKKVRKGEIVKESDEKISDTKVMTTKKEVRSRC